MSKNKLFEENMKLVPFTANKYFKAFININKEFKEDLFQEEMCIRDRRLT